ncbi:MAG: hypothetical protein IIA82_08430 [Thaumarchaeota archaeon]|nr:hypothetical protein [Nitrososphaerota archaeon]
MSQDEFSEILSKELRLASFLGLILPTILYAVLVIIYSNETGNNLPVYVWSVPLSYIVIFLLIYEKKFFRKREKSKFFKALTFERAIIRFEYLEKLQKYSMVTLIIISILVGIGIFLTISDKQQLMEQYNSQQSEYENKIKKTYGLTEDELRNYFHEQILEMSTLQVDRRIVTLFGNELLERNENATFAEFHQPGNEILWRIDNDLDRRNLLHNKYNEMNYDELKKTLLKELEQLKPFPFIDEISNNTFIEFLIFVWLIPVVMAYMIFPFKYTLTKFSDFYYLSAKGCFIIVRRFKDLDQMTKRKYLLMGLNYYENVVKKNTNLNINRLDEIKSTCVNYDSKHLTDLAHNFVKYLEKDNKLELLASIQNKIQVSDTSKFLIHISLTTRIKENWQIIATVISTIFTIVSYLTDVLSTTS